MELKTNRDFSTLVHVYGYRCSPGNYCTFDDLSTPGQLCGNGQYDSGEECDNSFSDNSDGCSNQCKIMEGFRCSSVIGSPSICSQTICGDGIIEGLENCDDGSDDGVGCALGC